MIQDPRTINELYTDLLSTLRTILSLTQFPDLSNQYTKFYDLSDEFPLIQSLNSDILSPLKDQLISLTSPQLLARD